VVGTDPDAEHADGLHSPASILHAFGEEPVHAAVTLAMMSPYGPTAKSRPGPETSHAGCRSDMRRRSPNRREWREAEMPRTHQL